MTKILKYKIFPILVAVAVLPPCEKEPLGSGQMNELLQVRPLGTEMGGTGEGIGGEKVTAGRSETKGGKQRDGGRTGKSCWPCISAWWHLAGPI